jgi:hypothetical protein
LVKKKKVGHTHELSLSEDFYDYFTFQEADGKSATHSAESSEGESGSLPQESLKEKEQE